MRFLEFLSTMGKELVLLVVAVIFIGGLFVFLYIASAPRGVMGGRHNQSYARSYALFGGVNQADINTANQKLARNPRDIAALKDRAQAYFYAGDTGKAIADLTEAISIAPDDPSLYNQRADMYDHAGDLGAAKQDRDKAAQLPAFKLPKL